MSDPTARGNDSPGAPGPASSIQFDRAEYGGAGGNMACASCHQPIARLYYEMAGQVICEGCRDRVDPNIPKGTSLTRFLRATTAGAAAAAAGAALYFAITKATGYEIGLIAIVVGFAVGGAVRWGSHGRGGWRYQTIAVALTYMAIVSTYVPYIIEGIGKQSESDVSGPSSTPNAAQSVQAGSVAPTPVSAPDVVQEASVAGALIGLAALMAVAIAAPFLAGFENIIGIVIIGIGVYEAWKLNRRTAMTVTGPHHVEARRSGSIAAS